jgi:hypothetical protein
LVSSVHNNVINLNHYSYTSTHQQMIRSLFTDRWGGKIHVSSGWPKKKKKCAAFSVADWSRVVAWSNVRDDWIPVMKTISLHARPWILVATNKPGIPDPASIRAPASVAAVGTRHIPSPHQTQTKNHPSIHLAPSSLAFSSVHGQLARTHTEMAASLEQEGVVFIVLPDRVGAGDDAEWVEERRLTTFSPRRAALALAVAGCFCLGAAWQLLAAGWGGRGASPSSFLLPLHAKSQNWTAAGVQAFQDRCVQLVQQFHRPLVFCNQAVVSWSFGGKQTKTGTSLYSGGVVGFGSCRLY